MFEKRYKAQTWRDTTNIISSLYLGIAYDEYYHPGNIKDLMIFRRALSIADIRYIMDRTNPYRYGAGLNYPLLYKR